MFHADLSFDKIFRFGIDIAVLSPTLDRRMNEFLKMVILIGLGLLALTVFGCLGSSSVRQTPEDRRYQGEAGFDPWKTHGFPVVVGETTRAVATPQAVDRSLNPAVTTTLGKSGGAGSKRLQILTTTDRAVADATTGGARDKLKITFQMKFEPPYYRVRSQDCFGDKEADSLLQVALDNGFGNAWLVPCN